jgi:hypothetical protein
MGVAVVTFGGAGGVALEALLCVGLQLGRKANRRRLAVRKHHR